jgi:hypothetical protein
VKSEINEFLITEFTENFEIKRHFQSQRQNLIGVYFTLVLATPIILDKLTNNNYKGLLLILLFIIGFLIFILLIMNRKYSTTITKQINCIRNYFISKSQNPKIESFFSNNYLNKNYPVYLNFKSDSFVIFSLFALLNSIAISSGTYFLKSWTFVPPLVFFLSIFLHMIISKRALR